MSSTLQSQQCGKYPDYIVISKFFILLLLTNGLSVCRPDQIHVQRLSSHSVVCFDIHIAVRMLVGDPCKCYGRVYRVSSDTRSDQIGDPI